MRLLELSEENEKSPRREKKSKLTHLVTVRVNLQHTPFLIRNLDRLIRNDVLRSTLSTGRGA